MTAFRQRQNIILFIILAFLPVLSFAQIQNARSSYTIISGGAERSYMMYVPEHRITDSLPLVFNFHGSGGVPQNQEDVSQFIRLARENQVVVVYPAGAFTNTLTDRSWNANVEAGVDDVRFVRDMIEHVDGMLPIDRRRIYATGFSGGARMSSRLACELSDVLAAAAPVAGLQYPDDCIQSRAIPILTFHGKADSANTYELTAQSRPYWRMGVETAIDQWRQANGCSLDNDTSWLSETVTFHAWTGCEGEAEIHFYIIADGGHTWPGSAQTRNAPGAGVTNMEINASEIIWDFFSRHRLP